MIDPQFTAEQVKAVREIAAGMCYDILSEISSRGGFGDQVEELADMLAARDRAFRNLERFPHRDSCA